MGLFEDLKELGVDVDGGLKRIGGNEALYKRLLNTFVKAMKGQQVSPDFDITNYEDVKERLMRLKGRRAICLLLLYLKHIHKLWICCGLTSRRKQKKY